MDGETTRTMRILSKQGDTQVAWRPAYKVEVDLATKEFDKLSGLGYATFSVEAPGAKPTQIRKFDPNAYEILAIPAIRGG